MSTEGRSLNRIRGKSSAAARDPKKPLTRDKLDLGRVLAIMEEHGTKAKLMDLVKKLGERDRAVMVLGETGSGKSTTINYLAGRRLKEVTIGINKCYETRDPEDTAAIGHEMNSKTLVPEVTPVTDGNLSVNFIDTAGFQDSRGMDYKLVASFSLMQMIEQLPLALDSVLIVLTWNDLLNTRMQALDRMFETMRQLFKDKSVEELKPRIFYFITKVPDGITEEVMDTTIVSAIDDFTTGDMGPAAKRQRVFMAEHLYQYYQLIRPMDGDKRSDLLNMVVVSKGTKLKDRNVLQKSWFGQVVDLSLISQARGLLTNAAAEPSNQLQALLNSAAAVAAKVEALQVAMEEIARTKAQKESLNDEANLAKILEDENDALDDDVTNIKEKMGMLADERKSIDGTIDSIESESRQYDSQAEEVLWTKSGGKRDWVYKDSDAFAYHGLPFDRVAKETSKGHIVGEYEDKEAGTYKFSFRPESRARMGSFKVTVLVKRCNMPESVAEKSNLRGKVDNLNERSSELREQLNALTREAAVKKKTMRDNKRKLSQDSYTLESKRADCDRRIVQLEETAGKLNEQISAAKQAVKDVPKQIAEALSKSVDFCVLFMQSSELRPFVEKVFDIGKQLDAFLKSRTYPSLGATPIDPKHAKVFDDISLMRMRMDAMQTE